jgi:hypothetical protein
MQASASTALPTAFNFDQFSETGAFVCAIMSLQHFLPFFAFCLIVVFLLASGAFVCFCIKNRRVGYLIYICLSLESLGGYFLSFFFPLFLGLNPAFDDIKIDVPRGSECVVLFSSLLQAGVSPMYCDGVLARTFTGPQASTLCTLSAT